MDVFSEDFYAAFGKAAYAMALADGALQPEEHARLLAALKEKLAALETQTDEFGANLSYYTVFAFEQEAEKGPDWPGAMDDFFAYVEENQLELPVDVKDRLVDILQEIAEAHDGIVASEQELLHAFIHRITNAA